VCSFLGADSVLADLLGEQSSAFLSVSLLLSGDARGDTLLVLATGLGLARARLLISARRSSLEVGANAGAAFGLGIGSSGVALLTSFEFSVTADGAGSSRREGRRSGNDDLRGRNFLRNGGSSGGLGWGSERGSRLRGSGGRLSGGRGRGRGGGGGGR